MKRAMEEHYDKCCPVKRPVWEDYILLMIPAILCILKEAKARKNNKNVSVCQEGRMRWKKKRAWRLQEPMEVLHMILHGGINAWPMHIHPALKISTFPEWIKANYSLNDYLMPINVYIIVKK